jgi:hypothetical protein
MDLGKDFLLDKNAKASTVAFRRKSAFPNRKGGFIYEA